MSGYLFSRLLQTLVTLFVMSVLVFGGLHMVGNPVDVLLSPTATPAERLEVIRSFGLDQPV
ncbi:ABC transporter permease, partial [Rhodovulum sulfidophilum]|nr:ABC transporter permease [Rhodovulum sulfidophilum]